jgi:hypothetical protein
MRACVEAVANLRRPRAISTLLSLAVLAVPIAGFASLGCSVGGFDGAEPVASGGASDLLQPSDAGAPAVADAGSSRRGGPIAARMNDVSILFPLPSNDAEVARLLSASSRGARGALLPEALYTNRTVGPIAGSGVPNDDAGVEYDQPPRAFPAFAAYSDLHVVAMRLDPCFGSLAPDPQGVGCTAQIRLTFEEVRPSGDDAGGTAFDSAMHVFYALTRDEFLSLARALVALRVERQGATVLGPLAPNPIMVAEGLAGPMATGVKALILRYAGEQNLTRAAQISGASGLGDMWMFSAADVSDATAGTSSPSAIATLSNADAGLTPPFGDATGGVFAQNSGATLPSKSTDFSAFLLPRTTGSDDILPIDTGSPSSVPAAAQQAAFDALVRVENPRDESPTTIDCGSCHFATPTEALVAGPILGLDDTKSRLSFAPDGKSVTLADMTPTFDTTSPVLSIHAFSYVGTRPTINQRVVNETAAVVEYLNDLPAD